MSLEWKADQGFKGGGGAVHESPDRDQSAGLLRGRSRREGQQVMRSKWPSTTLPPAVLLRSPRISDVTSDKGDSFNSGSSISGGTEEPG